MPSKTLLERIQSAPLIYKGALILLFPLFAMLIAGLFSLGAINKYTEQRQMVEKSFEVRRHLFNAKVDVALIWDEHLKAFVFGHEVSEPFDSEQVKKDLQSSMEQISVLLADDPEKTHDVNLLRGKISVWLDTLHEHDVALMEGSASPLDHSKESLLPTSKLSEDILRDLEMLSSFEMHLLENQWAENEKTRNKAFGLMGLSIILGLLGGLFSSAFVMGRMTKRLSALRDYAAGRSAGEVGESILESGDEIAQLAKAFRESADQTQKREQELKETKEELEVRVQERTAELYLSVAQAKGTIEFSPIGIALVALDGKWISVNPALCELVGRSEEELLAGSFQDITHPDDLNEDLELLHAVLDGKIATYQMEKRYYHKNGNIVSVLLNVSLVLSKLGEPLHFISQIQDNTEKKKLENSLLKSRNLLEQMGKMAKIGGWELETTTNELFWTEEVYRIYGVTELPSVEEAINFYAPEARPLISGAINHTIETGEPWDLEVKFNPAEGEQIWVRTQGGCEHKEGKTTRLFGAFQDITERKKNQILIEEAAIEAEAQVFRLKILGEITKVISGRHDMKSVFNVVLAHLRDYFAVDLAAILNFDQDSKVIVVGARSEAVPDKNVAPLLRVGSFPKLEESGLEDCIKGETIHFPSLSDDQNGILGDLAQSGFGSAVIAPIKTSKLTLGVLLAVRKDQNTFSNDDSDFLSQLGEHIALAIEQIRILESLRNVSEDLKEAQDLVTQQERLRAMGEMASGIAHDINNALGPVGLHCEMLLDFEKMTSSAKKSIQAILDSVGSASKTIAGLRHFYKPNEDSSLFQKTSINDVIKDIIALTKPRWKDVPEQKGYEVNIVLKLDPSEPQISCIKSDLRNVITNLVFNAADSITANGEVTITTKREMNRVLIFISDTGSGMDELTRKRCIEPFFTTKGVNGTGLGLAMVYGVMKRHQGIMEIESEIGKGTIIQLVFPTNKQKETKPDSPDDELLRPSNSLKILCVDDDQPVRATLTLFLEKDGHQVTQAEDGNEALEICKKGNSFDMIITDLGMPGMDGQALAVAIHERWPDQKIILLTGWGSHLVDEADDMINFVSVLPKPAKAAEVRAALAKACG